MSASTAASISAGEQTVCIGLVTDLARAMKNISFYDLAHPMVRTVLAGLHADLTAYLRERREFSVKFVSGYIVLQDVPLVAPHASLGNLLGACLRRQAESLVFRRGVTLEDLEQLVAVLAADPGGLAEEGGLARALEARGVERILAGRLASGSKRDWRWVHSTALDVLRGAAMGVRTGRPVDVTGVQKSVCEIVEDVLGDRSILYNLTSLKGMDEYTFIHALNICVLAGELGRQIRLDRQQLDELGIATLLHDVGKILVPLEILRKPGPLEEPEFQVMSRHPVDGSVLLAREPKLPEVVAVVSFEHHMRCDLSGYPRTRWPRSLHLYSMMACISDIYDALTTTRPYRPPLPPLRALELMQTECQAHVEPRLFRQFVTMLGPYPWGTLLGLPGGRLGVVTRPNAAAPDNPFARVLETECQPARAAEEEVPVRSLARQEGEFQVLDPVMLGLDLTAILHGLQAQGPASPAPGEGVAVN